MRTLLLLIAGLAVISVDAGAQPFQVDDVPSVDAVPLAQIKPRSIVFSDRGSDIAEAGNIFTRFEDWAKAKPTQAQFLTLYPGYTEPNVDVTVDGTKKHIREKLHVYVAEARFLIAKASASLDLAHFVMLPFVQQLDPAIGHRLISTSDLPQESDPRMANNENPQHPWCASAGVTICVHSSYKLEGRLPVGVALANKIRESGKKPISDTLEFDSELDMLRPEDVTQRGLPALTGLATPPVGALDQSIFFVNEVIEFGKMLAVFQQHPSDANRTVVTVFVLIALDTAILTKQEKYANVPVLRNLLPAQVLAGKSSFNSGNSLSAGLPVYASNQIKAIAALLEK